MIRVLPFFDIEYILHVYVNEAKLHVSSMLSKFEYVISLFSRFHKITIIFDLLRRFISDPYQTFVLLRREENIVQYGKSILSSIVQSPPSVARRIL